MAEPNPVQEEIARGMGLQLEALRLEIRAASRRRGGDGDEAGFYEVKADGYAVAAEAALGSPLRSYEARTGG